MNDADGLAAELAEIEALPLAERSDRYLGLMESLRTRLEDPDGLDPDAGEDGVPGA